MNAYSISKLADDACVSVHVVRDYMIRGLLRPVACTTGGYGVFDDAALQRLCFVRAAFEAGLGLDPEASWREVRLDGPVRRNPHRPMARPAMLRMEGGEVRATVPVWQGSGDLAHLAGTDGVVMIDHGDAEAAAGSIVRFLPW